MPDAHVGYGLPIGGVLAAYNAVIPYGVGMDIGCRMCMSVYPVSPKIIDTQKERLSNILFEETRFGLSKFNDIIDPDTKEVVWYCCGHEEELVYPNGNSLDHPFDHFVANWNPDVHIHP